MKHCSAAERLYPLLQQGPTIRHHTARALVYLGEIDTKGVSVFHRSNGECVRARVRVCVCVWYGREMQGVERERERIKSSNGEMVCVCVCVW